MIIDAYIYKYKSYANDYEKGRYKMDWSVQQRNYAICKAREYRQLAEWLEELNTLRYCKDKWNENQYQQGRAEGESIGITRVLDILESLDNQMLQKVKDALYEQDFKELKEKK